MDALVTVRQVVVEYGCREVDGSLKPVPPGQTRRALYCGGCEALRCLFEPGPWYLSKEKDLVKVRSGKQKGAKMRARGLNSNGEPLQASCWNCQSLRAGRDSRYACVFDPQGSVASRWVMTHTRTVVRTGCALFEMRLVVEIPHL